MVKKVLQYVKLAFQKGLIHILAGSFMTKLVAFFGSIFLVRVLSKQEYGVLSYLDNLYGYVHVFAGMGMANAVLRYVVLGKSTEEKHAYYRYANISGFVWNVILIILAGAFFAFYPHKADYQAYIWLLDIMLLMLPFQYVTENVLSNERAMFANQRYATFALVLSTLIISSKIAAGFLDGLNSVIFVQTGVYIVMSVLMSISTQKAYYKNAGLRKLENSDKRAINSYALQYMITNGLWTIFMLNDTFLLGRYSDPGVLADYRVSYTIPGCVNLISTAIGIYIGPYFVKNENDRQWIRTNFKWTYLASAAAVGFVCLVIAVLAKPVVWLLYGEQYLNIVPIMRVLLLAAFFNCGLRYTTANLLASMGQVKYNMIVSLIGMVLQVGINIMVIPAYGSIGVAATSCVVYLFMAVVLLVVFIKKHFVGDSK